MSTPLSRGVQAPVASVMSPFCAPVACPAAVPLTQQLNPKAVPFRTQPAPGDESSPQHALPVSPSSTPGLTPSASPLHSVDAQAADPSTPATPCSATPPAAFTSPPQRAAPWPALPVAVQITAPEAARLSPTADDTKSVADSGKGDSAGTGGSWCPRFSHTDEAGAVVVRTPWYPEGVAKDRIRLGDEVTAFWRLVSLTPGERALRQALRLTVQSTVNKVWADAVTKLSGCHALGVALPHTPLDLVVEDCGDGSDAWGMRAALMERVPLLAAERDAADGSGAVRICAGDVDACVRFAPGRSDERRAVALLRDALKQHPHAAPAAAVVSTVLGQVRCDDPNTGGVSADAVLLMVLHVCAVRRKGGKGSPRGGKDGGRRDERHGASAKPEDDAGAVLRDFFSYYAKDFDFARSSVAPLAAEAPARQPGGLHDGDAVSIIDPLFGAAGGNAAGACTAQKLLQVQGQLKYCHMALTKYDGMVPAGAKRGYKGRTPLSTIVSLQPLWPRAETVFGVSQSPSGPAGNVPRITAGPSGNTPPTPSTRPAAKAPPAAAPIDLPELSLSP